MTQPKEGQAGDANLLDSTLCRQQTRWFCCIAAKHWERADHVSCYSAIAKDQRQVAGIVVLGYQLNRNDFWTYGNDRRLLCRYIDQPRAVYLLRCKERPCCFFNPSPGCLFAVRRDRPVRSALLNFSRVCCSFPFRRLRCGFPIS